MSEQSQNANTGLENQIEQCESLRTSVNNLQRSLNCAVSKGSDLSLVTTLEKCRKCYQSYRKQLRETFDKHENVKLFIDEAGIQQSLQAIQEVTLQLDRVLPKPDRNLHLSLMNDTRAEMLVEFNGRAPGDTKVCDFRGGVFLHDGRLVLCDYDNNKVASKESAI